MRGLVESAQNESRKNLAGQMSLFDIGGAEAAQSLSATLPDVAPFSRDISLRWRRKCWESISPITRYESTSRRSGP